MGDNREELYTQERVLQDIREGKTYTTQQFASLVGRTERTLASWREMGKLVPHKDFSGRNVYTNSDLLLVRGVIVRGDISASG